MKFDKVEGNMVFPERSKENWMKAEWISEVQRCSSEAGKNMFKAQKVLLFSLLATTYNVETGWNPACQHIMKASCKD